ncbi:MAG TPA: hypothetical protein VF423_07925 [Actinomycetes bacterium]
MSTDVRAEGALGQQADAEPQPPRRPWQLWVAAAMVAAFGALLVAVSVGDADRSIPVLVIGCALLGAAVGLVVWHRVGWWLAVVLLGLVVALLALAFADDQQPSAAVAAGVVLVPVVLLLMPAVRGRRSWSAADFVEDSAPVLDRPTGWTKEWGGGWVKLVLMSLLALITVLVGLVMTLAALTDDRGPALAMPLVCLAFGVAIVATLPMFWPRRAGRPVTWTADVAGRQETGVAFRYARARSAGALVGCLAFCVSGLLLTVAGEGWGIRLVGVLAFTVFGFFAFYFVRKGLGRGWALLATPRGIGVVDGPGRTFLPWETVSDVRAGETTTYHRGIAIHEPHIAVDVDGAVDYDDALDETLAKVGSEFSGSDVTWSVRALSVDPVRVLTSMRHYLRHAEHRDELGDERSLARIARNDLDAGTDQT